METEGVLREEVEEREEQLQRLRTQLARRRQVPLPSPLLLAVPLGACGCEQVKASAQSKSRAEERARRAEEGARVEVVEEESALGRGARRWMRCGADGGGAGARGARQGGQLLRPG
eukprot:1437198-Rhodomonas_salina.1